ncbi:SUZ domain-containing protein 1 [Patella vulgata]|uniref:SUZ domain-containing protein 1 n=1 Tax=Patella vulgata TaxID=6465 RepID=UPI00217F2351|nr:SUZ domain-containing protein 1 [Patella vulgata]
MAEDGEGFDSWEEQEDSGMLDKRIGELKLETSATVDKDGSNMLVKEISSRTEYTPQVRILKRDHAAQNQNVSNKIQSQASKPSKTLEEREAEYAEARQRIFGDEAPPLEEDTDSESRPVRLICKVEEPLGNNVIRQPRGPDGTKGFNMDR